MNAPLAGAAPADAPAAGGAVLIDLTESVVRAVHGGAVVEWPTTVGYLDPQSTDPNRIVAGEPIARVLGANPLSGVRLLPTLIDTSHILLNDRPHAVSDLLTRLLAPALPAKAAIGDPEIVVAHPSTWGLPRVRTLRSSAAKLGARCSLLPRSLALVRAFANPSGHAVAVIEAQASSVDISLLTNRGGGWSPLESRKLSAHMGISLAEMGFEVSRELSDILQEKTGKSDCSKALDGLIIDAPPKLAEAIVAQIHENDSAFDKIVAAPRDGALRGLVAPAAAPVSAIPEPPQPVAAPQSPAASPAFGASASTPSPTLPSQAPAPPGPPPYQPAEQALQNAGPQYGRPVYTPHQPLSDEQQSPEIGLPVAQSHALPPQGPSAPLDSAFPEPKSSRPPVAWIAAAVVLAILLAGGMVWLVSGHRDQASPRTQGAPPALVPHDEAAETQLVNIPDPDSNGAVLFSFQLPVSWAQAQQSACGAAQSSSTEERLFRSAPLFFHSPGDPCAEIGVRYEGLDAQATLQSVGESIRAQIGESSGRFTNLQFGVPHGLNTFNSYDQPERNASWFLYVAPHKDSKLLVSIGCRNAAQGPLCERALQTLKVAP